MTGRRRWHSSSRGVVVAPPHQGGADNRATRMADEDQETWAPTVADLGDFVGRYFSEEIETFYDVVLEGAEELNEDEEAEQQLVLNSAERTIATSLLVRPTRSMVAVWKCLSSATVMTR